MVVGVTISPTLSAQQVVESIAHVRLSCVDNEKPEEPPQLIIMPLENAVVTDDSICSYQFKVTENYLIKISECNYTDTFWSDGETVADRRTGELSDLFVSRMRGGRQTTGLNHFANTQIKKFKCEKWDSDEDTQRKF